MIQAGNFGAWIMAGEFWLDNRQWAVIEPLLPKNQPGAHRKDDRRVISGIIHVLKVGCRWQDCPAAYGPPTTIYNRFIAGHGAGSGGNYSRPYQWPIPMMFRWSTAPPPRRIARQPAEKGGRAPGDRPLSRRANDKNPCCCRWLRSSHRARNNPRPARRRTDRPWLARTTAAGRSVRCGYRL